MLPFKKLTIKHDSQKIFSNDYVVLSTGNLAMRGILKTTGFIVRTIEISRGNGGGWGNIKKATIELDLD